MIKLFRQIRYTLIEKNKTGKYFKYAVGEIVLVVVGILIALSINNWNEERKLNKQEAYLLAQMQKEFEGDSVMLNRFIFLSNKKVKEGKLLRRHMDGEIDMPRDSIVAFSFFNGKAILFNSYSPTFDEIVSSGNLGVIRSDALKTRIKDYKNIVGASQSFLYYEGQRRKEAYNTHLYKYFEAELMTHIWKQSNGKSFRIEGLESFEIDVDGFFTDPETRYQINTIIGVDQELSFTYEGRFQMLLNRILTELQTEIDKSAR